VVRAYIFIIQKVLHLETESFHDNEKRIDKVLRH